LETGWLYPGRCWRYLTYATTISDDPYATSMSDDPIHVPPRHRLNIVSELGFVVLRRLDGTEARASPCAAPPGKRFCASPRETVRCLMKIDPSPRSSLSTLRFTSAGRRGTRPRLSPPGPGASRVSPVQRKAPSTILVAAVTRRSRMRADRRPPELHFHYLTRPRLGQAGD
jgi:hypothetical protein